MIRGAATIMIKGDRDRIEDGMRLVQLLVPCTEVVTCRDRKLLWLFANTSLLKANIISPKEILIVKLKMGFIVELLKQVARCFYGVSCNVSVSMICRPLIALVYPLYISVQAIEANAHAENRKLLTYWVLCVVIMLFELTSVKLIEWLPFWPFIKLMITFWLIVPSLDGAVYAYDHFVRPCYYVNVQTFVDWLKPKKDERHIRDSNEFVLLAQQYVQENGSEALEKLLLGKDKHIIEQPNCRTADNTLLTSMKKKEAAEALKETKLLKPNLIHAAIQNKATTAADIAGEGCELPKSSYPKKVQKEWTCALCQVCTLSEGCLQSHLRGKKHKSKELELMTKKNEAKNKTSSASNSKKTDTSKARSNEAVGLPASVPNDKLDKKPKELRAGIVGTGPSGENSAKMNQNSAKLEVKPPALWCDTCKVQCSGLSTLTGHLHGKKHRACMQAVLVPSGIIISEKKQAALQ
ncbi:hypothetical protein IFM89_005289 [Coptis chinensis]|uniref:U1-type domain-containing protein n=1 Tax=Coptis chinensis TaxID=261450 RepID=A0A835MBR5_9MAGN|nr:hypothetical protein IFM89_005289 [Coptis chinensis]